MCVNINLAWCKIQNIEEAFFSETLLHLYQTALLYIFTKIVIKT